MAGENAIMQAQTKAKEGYLTETEDRILACIRERLISRFLLEAGRKRNRRNREKAVFRSHKKEHHSFETEMIHR